jgi:hypothetical protein
MAGDIPRCRSCWAALRFIRMTSGKSMPVEPVKDPRGIVAARKVGSGYVDGFVLSAAVPDAPEGYDTFRPHWADCEHAKRAHQGETEALKPRDRTSDFLF